MFALEDEQNEDAAALYQIRDFLKADHRLLLQNQGLVEDVPNSAQIVEVRDGKFYLWVE